MRALAPDWASARPQGLQRGEASGQVGATRWVHEWEGAANAGEWRSRTGRNGAGSWRMRARAWEGSGSRGFGGDRGR